MLGVFGERITDSQFFERGAPHDFPTAEEESPPPTEKDWHAFFVHSQKILGLFLMFTFLTAGLVLVVLSWQQKATPEVEKTSVLGVTKDASPAANPTPPVLTVDLAGAINKAGVFRLAEGSRLEELLQLAGGLSAAADEGWAQKNLNLAEKLFDGEKIYIPSRTEVAAGTGQGWGGATAPLSGAKVNINTASAAQLDALPGLSSADAQGIVEYRQKNGPFKDISEVQRVSGIKAGKFAKIKDFITVN